MILSYLSLCNLNTKWYGSAWSLNLEKTCQCHYCLANLLMSAALLPTQICIPNQAVNFPYHTRLLLSNTYMLTPTT